MIRRRARSTVLVAAGLIAVLLAGCTTNAARFPVPGVGVQGDVYRVTIEFANALNLPAQAKVLSNGTRIGVLRGVTVAPAANGVAGHVEAAVDIATSVSLPSSTRASLRQSTLLGDIYIVLDTSAASGAPLEDGGVIPLMHTESSSQIEDLMAGLATFVTGGSITHLDSILRQTNDVFPADPQRTAQVFDALGRTFTDVSDDLDAADEFLNALDTNVDAVLDNQQQLSEILTPEGAATLTADGASLAATIGMMSGFSMLTRALQWLEPLLASGDAAVSAFVPLVLGDRPLDLDSPTNLNRLYGFLRDDLVPFAQAPRYDITVETDPVPTGAVPDELSRMITALGMIGAVG